MKAKEARLLAFDYLKNEIKTVEDLIKKASSEGQMKIIFVAKDDIHDALFSYFHENGFEITEIKETGSKSHTQIIHWGN